MSYRVFLTRVYARWLVFCGRCLPRQWRLRHLAQPMQVIAHRGASHLAPENTLASINLAWKHGADVVEVDVHLTQDRRIVAIHDATTIRTANTDLKVAATHSSDLRLLDVGSHKHVEFAGETIPFLEEVLETVPPGRQLFIEIKCGPEILPVLDEIVTAGGKRPQVVIIGFDLLTMKAAKEIMPDVPALWLCDRNLWTPFGRSLARRAKAHGLDGMSVHWSGITWRFVRAVRKAGLKLYAWTVDHPADAARLHALGVDGITTNHPGWLRKRILARHRRDRDTDPSHEQNSKRIP